MSEDPYVPNVKDEVAPHYKDQAASVPAERRPPRNRDPEGTLLAANDATRAVGESSNKAATQAETGEPPPPPPPNNSDVLDRGSSTADDRPSVTHVPIAFVVDDAADNPRGNSNESNMDHHQKSFPWNTAIVAVVVIVIAIVAGVVVGKVCGSGGCGGKGNGDNPSPPTTMAPTTPSPVEGGNGNNTYPPTTLAPTTLSPTKSPSPTSPRSQDITNFINSNTYMGVDLSPAGTSPEELALQWLIHDDPLQLNVGAESDEFRILQRYSLLTLWFQGDTGTTWRNSTSWLNADECTWFGINCQSGVVTVVAFYPEDEIDGNGLQGSLSPDLGLLTDLTRFYISHNMMSGSLPSEIGLWTNLQRFAVGDNNLTGSLPSVIGLLENLEWFYIYGNVLTGPLPSEIGLWTNLERFYGSNNNLTGFLPSEIGLWTNLVQFDVGSNSLRGSLPSEIGLWTNLQQFYVSENLLTGSLPSEIGLWTDLERFSVSNNALTGTIPATIANWTLIERAYFDNNNFSGSMPCEFTTDTDFVLWADCDDVTCSCCTHCK